MARIRCVYKEKECRKGTRFIFNEGGIEESLREPNSSSSKSKSNKKTDSSGFYMPPIWIICTHKNSSLASPKLVADGKRLAQEWNCGFIAIDNLDDSVDELLAYMIRDIIQTNK